VGTQPCLGFLFALPASTRQLNLEASPGSGFNLQRSLGVCELCANISESPVQNSSDQSTFRLKISNESRRFKPFTQTLDGDPGVSQIEAPARPAAIVGFSLRTVGFLKADTPEEERQLARRSDKPFLVIEAHIQVAAESVHRKTLQE
jgi:hypothetical protein